MGSSSSKVAKGATSAAAASTARRQYPSTPSIPTTTTSNSSITGARNAPSTSAPTSASTATNTPRPAQVHPQATTSMPRVSTSKTAAVDLDGRDPDFGARLGRIGPVEPSHPGNESLQSAFASSPSSSSPSPSHSYPSSRPNPSNNPAVLIVQARDRYTRAFEAERENLGRASFGGRTLISAAELKNVLAMREAGTSEAEIERSLRLQRGLVARLGREARGGGMGVVRNVV